MLAALVFVGFLVHQAGQLTGNPAPWRYTLIIGAAAAFGRAGRTFYAALRHRRSHLVAEHSPASPAR